jgi:hypothetical protein
MVAGMKATTDAWVGDTLYLEKSPVEPLPGNDFFIYHFIDFAGLKSSEC